MRLEGRTPTVAVDDAELVVFRSTAGSCFGRFIGLVLFVGYWKVLLYNIIT